MKFPQWCEQKYYPIPRKNKNIGPFNQVKTIDGQKKNSSTKMLAPKHKNYR